jgi:hypothetical protein
MKSREINYSDPIVLNKDSKISFSQAGLYDCFSIEKWAQYFNPFNREIFVDDCGASLRFEEQESLFTLYIFYMLNYGISFMIETYNTGDDTFLCVNIDNTKLKEFVFTDRGEVIPVGSFMPADEAFKLISEFISNPTQPPESFKWKDTSEIDNWPEY